jgi:dipeptide transport system permease protein
MLKYLLSRAAVLVPTFIGVTVVAFSLIRLVPGDPVMIMLGERGASPEIIAEMRANLGLDRPVIEQYFGFVSKAARGDLGESIISKEPVLKEFLDRFPATLELSCVALFFAVFLGVPLGILAAVRRGTWADYLVMGGALVGYSMPIFWWGLILILFFSVQLGWTPVSGRLGLEFEVPATTGFVLIDVWYMQAAAAEKWAAFWSALRHVILPSVALGTIPLAMIARMTRSSMLEVLGEDYIRTARAKGLSRIWVIGVHALRNALIPVVTVIGLTFGTLITGAVLTETIFSWPGIGKWLLKSVTSRDYPVIQGGILLIAALIVLVNMAVDIIYAIINPRIRDQ